ncbi:MAG: methylenetetrahydrofolate reductase [NAD(P)H] [Lachnospiraceae bacterium]
MKIMNQLMNGKVNISFEVFPPKTEAGYENVLKTTDTIAVLKPAFISVTYGAGGGTSRNTVGIASHIQKDLKVTSLAHLTCASSTKSEVEEVIEQLKEEGIENILALRGDVLKEVAFPAKDRYQYANELVTHIKKRGDFCIGAACYPEGHVESVHKEDDLFYLKQKVDCGVDFLTTQMFFDNHILYNFLYRIREKGITVPVLPGIMSVTNKKQIARIAGMSGTLLPERFRAIVDCFGDNPAAMQQAGIAYATDQIVDLIANGVKNIHVYSMNKPEVAAAIMANLSEIIADPI